MRPDNKPPSAKSCWPLVFFGIACLCLFLGIMFTCEQLEPFFARRERSTRVVEQVSYRDRAPERTLVAREKWSPDTYFESPEAVLACKAIFSRDQAGLRKQIVDGLDINTSGKAGLTLLHWAFASNNLPAFETLLKAGANPEAKLRDTIYLRTSPRSFLQGDSILFTSVRSMEENRMKFFGAALAHSKQMDPRDFAGNTLLLTCMHPSAIFDLSNDNLDRLLKPGVDLDAQDKFGYTAAMLAVMWNRPEFALKILQAGADLKIRSDSEGTVADVLEIRVKQEARGGRQYFPQTTGQIREFIKEHAQK